MDIPQTMLELLRCSQCNGYLSKFPIYTYNNETHVCGRCPLTVESEPRRNRLYEHLATFANFPCPHQNCSEMYSPETLLIHETSCSNRNYPCPICDWKGIAENLEGHFTNNHNNHLLELNETFEINLDEKSESYQMIKGELNEIFIVRTVIKETEFSIGVMYAGLKNASRYNWSFSLYSNNQNDGLEFPKNKIDWYGNNDNFQSFFSTEIETLKSLQTAVLNCQVFITRDSDFVVEPEEPMEALNKFILNKLECPVCFETMYPPIFQCSNSHIICESCKKEYRNCPTCSVELGEIRNRFVEDIAEALKYTCRYDGCDATYMLRDKKAHEAICQYAPYNCTCGCDWQGDFNSLMQHLQTDHYENVLQHGTISAYFDDDTDVYAIIKCNSVFRVAQRGEDNNLQLSVQYWGPRDPNAINYDFSINFVNKETNRRLFLNSSCSMATSIIETFAGDNYIQLSDNLLKPFMEDMHLNYTLDIFPQLLIHN